MISYIYKIISVCLVFLILSTNKTVASNIDDNFDLWLVSFKEKALKKGISEKTLNLAFENVNFLEQVIKNGRFRAYKQR